MSYFECLKFQQVNQVLKNAHIDYGKICAKIESLLADFCEAKPSSSIDDNG